MKKKIDLNVYYRMDSVRIKQLLSSVKMLSLEDLKHLNYLPMFL